MSFVGGVGYSNIDLIYSGLDRLPDKGEEIFARGFSMQFGGGIPATMINLSRLGVESRIITFAGHDLFSEFVIKETRCRWCCLPPCYIVVTEVLFHIQTEWILMMLLWMKFMKI